MSSPELFRKMMAHITRQRELGVTLTTIEDLYQSFRLGEGGAPEETDEDAHADFETCVRLVESRGLVRRMTFGGLLLLQPDRLDAYASAIVDAARTDPDHLGMIEETSVKTGSFSIPEGERISDKNTERLLLVATTEDLINHDIAIREDTQTGQILVFPSEVSRDWPDAPSPEGQTIAIAFEGGVRNIYATLAVRLSHCGIFNREKMWRNAVLYRATVGGNCGIWLREYQEGHGDLILFFEEDASEETRHNFEAFVSAHLERRAVRGSIERRRLFACVECRTPLLDLAITKRRQMGYTWIQCNVCGTKISLLDGVERLRASTALAVAQMNHQADESRQRAAARVTLEGKQMTQEFDVFICYNRADREQVKIIERTLIDKGIRPWRDEREMKPGVPWQRQLEQQIGQVRSAAVFIGSRGSGQWQEMEIEALIRAFVERKCPVIPVILANVKGAPKMPEFLSGMHYVDFRQAEPNPIDQLIRGIKGDE